MDHFYIFTTVCLGPGTVPSISLVLSNELPVQIVTFCGRSVSITKNLLETDVHSVTCFPLQTLCSRLYNKHYSIPSPSHSVYLSGEAEHPLANYITLGLKIHIAPESLEA